MPDRERGRVGAPPGLFVHWLNLELVGEFTAAYKLTFSQRHHNYRYARYKKKTLTDEFLIVRTSKRCYRVIYFNNDFKYFRYFSFKNYRSCARSMKEIYYIFRHLEEAREAEKPKKTKKNYKGNAS